MTTDKEHLQWIHNRIVEVYGESENVDFLVRMRKIIDKQDIEFNLLNLNMEYKILERKGNFMVGKMKKKRKWMFGKTYEEFNCILKSMYNPAHFKTLEEAREFVKVITKPDTYHTL